jgi:hypothetical protein
MITPFSPQDEFREAAEPYTFVGGCSENARFSHEAWPAPLPLPRRVLPDVPVLDERLIPANLRSRITDVAFRMQASPEAVAIAALVTISSLIGSECRVLPKQFDDWAVCPNLWGALIDYPGKLKSPILKAASVNFLFDLDVIARRNHESQRLDYDAQCAAHEALKSSIKEQMKKCAKSKVQEGGDGVTLESLTEELKKLVPPSEPRLKRYSTQSCTVEAAHELLASNPRGILLLADELVRLFRSWDSQGHEDDRGFFLEAWNGGVPYDHDTISRRNTHCPTVTVSLLGGIQPDKFQKYLMQANESDNDGLVQRLQLAVFPANRTWEWVDRRPDGEAAERVCRLLQKLDTLDYGAIGAEWDPVGQFLFIRFSPAATEVFSEWETQLRTEKIPAETNHLIAEHLSKYPSMMASLALIFCLVRTVGDGLHKATLTEDDARVAVDWCDFLEAHARKIYALIDDGKTASVAALDKAIREGRLNDGFTVRDVYRPQWAGLQSVNLAEHACEMLCTLRRLRKAAVKPSQQGGASTVRFFINPQLFGENAV